MPSIRFRLDGPPERAEATVRAEYGPDARLVSIEEVRLGGVGGFFARRATDVIVELPDVGPGAGAFASGAAFPPSVPGAGPSASGAAPGGVPGTFAGSAPGGAVPSGDGPGFPPFSPVRPASPGPLGSSGRPASSGAPLSPGMLASPGTPMEALLARADDLDVAFPRLSTESDTFSQLLGDLQRETTEPAPVREVEVLRPVVLLRAPGDLILLAGVGSDPLLVATALAAQHDRITVAVGGTLAGLGAGSLGHIPAGAPSDPAGGFRPASAPPGFHQAAASPSVPPQISHGFLRVIDARSALAARARGRETGRATVVAFGIDGSGHVAGVPGVGPGVRGAVSGLGSGAGPGVPGVGQVSAGHDPAALGADQVWAVVDASRKPLDTEAWVAALRASVPVQAMALLGAHRTSTPDTVRRLGLRQAWVEPVG